MNQETGLYEHLKNHGSKERKWLSSISYQKGKMVYPHDTPSPLPSYKEMLSIAEGMFEAIGSTFTSSSTTIGDQSLFLEDSMRWFLMPSDIVTEKKAPVPFTPHQYPNPPTKKKI